MSSFRAGQRHHGGALARRSVATTMWLSRDHSDACGIIGFVGDEPASPYILEGLNIMQSRGCVRARRVCDTHVCVCQLHP